MLNPEIIQRTQKFLFASEEEMKENHLTPQNQKRLLRLRDMYSYWLANPQYTESVIARELKSRYHLTKGAAYEDLHLIKLCLGNLNQASTDFYRWVFLQRAEEAFEMARAKDDPKAFASALNAFGKYTRLDAPEGNTPDYSAIVPQTFEVTGDPEAAGFKRIPNLEKKIKQLEARYINDSKTEPHYVEAQEVKPIHPTHVDPLDIAQ